MDVVYCFHGGWRYFHGSRLLPKWELVEASMEADRSFASIEVDGSFASIEVAGSQSTSIENISMEAG